MRVTSREKEGRCAQEQEGEFDAGTTRLAMKEMRSSDTAMCVSGDTQTRTERNGMEWKRKKQGEAQSTMTSNRTSNWKREESSKSNVGRVNYYMNQFSKADYTGNIVL